MADIPLATIARSSKAVPAAPAARLVVLDNLRILVIAVVILHHVGQAYIPTGGFWPIFNPTRAQAKASIRGE